MEKKRIQLRLLEEGRNRFSFYGLKKTTIQELTQAAGISQGAFYLFYPSKEALYFAVLEEEEKQIQAALLKRWEQNEKPTVKGMQSFLLEGLRRIDQSPLIRRLLEGGEYEALLSRLSPEEVEAHRIRDTDLVETLVQSGMGQVAWTVQDPAVVAGILRAFFLLTLHRREIGEEVFTPAIEHLARWIAQGLIREGEGIRD